MSRLKKIRMSRNLKQAELARLLKVTRAAMKYAVAFPKTTWMDLIELTPACAEK